PAAIFSLGDRAFEGAVLEGMVLNLDGEAFFGWIEAGAFGHGPADERAVHFEAEIGVETRGVVFLDNEAMGGARWGFAPWLRGTREISLFVIFAKWHESSPFNAG